MDGWMTEEEAGETEGGASEKQGAMMDGLRVCVCVCVLGSLTLHTESILQCELNLDFD